VISASEMLQWCNILEVAIDDLLLFGFSLISLSLLGLFTGSDRRRGTLN